MVIFCGNCFDYFYIPTIVKVRYPCIKCIMRIDIIVSISITGIIFKEVTAPPLFKKAISLHNMTLLLKFLFPHPFVTQHLLIFVYSSFFILLLRYFITSPAPHFTAPRDIQPTVFNQHRILPYTIKSKISFSTEKSEPFKF